MRRWIIIFFLCIFPLQASWAAVCAYCPGECVVEAERGAPAQAQAGDDDAASTLAVNDGDCNCCQLGGVGLTPRHEGLAAARLQMSESALTPTLRIESIRPDRPERPKWTRAA